MSTKCLYIVYYWASCPMDTWVNFTEHVLMASHYPYPIIVYSKANYRPHLSHFWTNVIFVLSNPYLSTFCLYIYL